MQKYLLTYDTVHGQFKGTVEVNAAGHLVVDGHEIVVYAEYDSLALSRVSVCGVSAPSWPSYACFWSQKSTFR